MTLTTDFSVLQGDLDYEGLARLHGTPLVVLDCDVARLQYRQLAAALPGVAIHYAIKALPDANLIRTLKDEGAGFDVASSGELDLLHDVGISPRRTIHTHPIKKPGEIRAALRAGCTTFVVDNEVELEKFVPVRERVSLLLRVSFRNPEARCDLSMKFGCQPDHVNRLLQRAADLRLHVKGMSFHVGSQSGSSLHHVRAIERCTEIMAAERSAGRYLSVLDIGGGFPTNYDGSAPGIDSFCAPIRVALNRLPEHVSVIAEPGRYLAAPAATLISSVVGIAERGDRTWYYLDDGVYGSFSGQIYDKTTYPIATLKEGQPTRPSVLAGPTCDSIDVIAEDIELPALSVGDLVIGRMMGAYTVASASTFNSLPMPKVLPVNEPAAERATVTYIA
jgi:ornithine decarboxylase